MEEKQLNEKFKLVITQDSVTSTDERFTMDDLYLGNNYKPLKVYFKRASGDIIRRDQAKGEHKISNKTLPMLALQVFEKQIAALSVEEKENFPICQYAPNEKMLCGIYPSLEEFLKHTKRSNLETVSYSYDNGRQFVIYGWNIFSTIIFVRECLKRFGEATDQFVLIYRDKVKKEKDIEKIKKVVHEEVKKEESEYLNSYSPILLESNNIIFRGAPGTGKSYLAKQIATDIISKGMFSDYTLLSDEQKEQIEFVQFHPSYDYSDFVEGLRPKVNEDGTMGFELQDGIFKKFCDRAKRNYEESDEVDRKKYIFIIDEINRGEISKIFGELFFSIDPGYRGRAGEISTQYSNMHKNPNDKFFIPENVYIIGTMNDIDRSVDSFDFAMRRRFRFIEIKVEENQDMLADLENDDLAIEAIQRMNALNKEIQATEGLNENYQIGASYFLKLKTLDFDQLWKDYLKPLLQEYIQGMYNDEGIMKRFERVYNGKLPVDGEFDEDTQD